jgi:hypothetical protein
MPGIGSPRLNRAIDSNFEKKLPKKACRGAKIGKSENGIPFVNNARI